MSKSSGEGLCPHSSRQVQHAPWSPPRQGAQPGCAASRHNHRNHLLLGLCCPWFLLALLPILPAKSLFPARWAPHRCVCSLGLNAGFCSACAPPWARAPSGLISAPGSSLSAPPFDTGGGSSAPRLSSLPVPPLTVSQGVGGLPPLFYLHTPPQRPSLHPAPGSSPPTHRKCGQLVHSRPSGSNRG